MSKRKHRHNRVTQIVSPNISIQQQTNTVTTKELWAQVAIAVASSDNAITKNSMVAWADHAVAAFKERF